MQIEAAKSLVKETLQNSFNKERFVYLIKNILHQFEEKKFSSKGNSIFDDFSDSIKLVECVGMYTDTKGKLIEILIIHLKKEGLLERSRTKLRNFVAKFLKNSRDGISKDAALVAFVSPNSDNWRFSLVKMDYKFNDEYKVEEVFTPARRHSFLVGKNENSHTAQSRLLPILLKGEINPTLKELEEIFNVERVTKEFFEQYRNLFLRVISSLDEITKKNPVVKIEFEIKKVKTHDFAKKLLGQIVFLYFLQKKGWFGVNKNDKWGSGSKQFLRELFQKNHVSYNNFFNDVLEPLFYQALRLERTRDYYGQFNCRIPFLNGGLFDPFNGYDWQNIDVLLPNELFSNDLKTKEGDLGDGILDIFDRYNFTVKEDEPLEKEVAVDPEMLGKVFENLLEIKNRKSKGTYYTPREIVHYMCQESLVNYLDIELKGKVCKKDIETLIKFGDSVVEHDLRVFTKGRETERYTFKLPESVRLHAKQIDEKLSSIRICDPAVGSGAFPVGMMNEIIRIRNTLSAYIQEHKKRTQYHFKRHAIQNCLYGVDIDQSAVEITKLRLWLTLIVDEEDRETIQPLPNLDYKIVQGNSLLCLEKEKDLFTLSLFNKLEKFKLLFFDEKNAREKQKYRSQINELINHITNGHENFDFKIYFSEVFHEKGGFDIVIANPPYVKEYIDKSVFDGLRNSPYYQGKMDLWYLFASKAIDITKKLGIVSFIAQNNWITSHGASKMRKKIISEAQILSLIDFGNFKIFEAGIQTMIMTFKKSLDLNLYTFDYRRLCGNSPELKDVISILNKDVNPKLEYINSVIKRDEFLNKTLTFNKSNIDQMLEKISSCTNFYLDPKKEVAQGIVCPQDCINKSSKKIIGSQYKIGDGIFVLSNAELKALNLSKKELLLVKPYYTTKELKKWCVDKENQRWIIYTDSSFKNNKKIEDYPNIKRHLDKFIKIITSDNKPYGLHRARDEYFFQGEKIIVARKCSRPNFTYVDIDCYVSATFYVIKTERIDQKYLLGILNSKLITFWLKHKGKMQGTNFQIDKEPILSIPLLQVGQNFQTLISKIVDKILIIKKSIDYLENAIKQSNVSQYEMQIDQLIYNLYGLNEEEIRVIESSIDQEHFNGATAVQQLA